MFKKLSLCLVLLIGMLAIRSPVFSANEAFYRDNWCKSQNGITEVKNDDRTRVDCITSEYAIEVEYASKWYEAIGQSLHYGIKTKKKPGIVLIMKGPNNMKYYHRLVNVLEYYSINIKVWVIEEK